MLTGVPLEQSHAVPDEPLLPVTDSEEASVIASADDQTFRLQEEATAQSGTQAEESEIEVAHGEQDHEYSISTGPETGRVSATREDCAPEAHVDQEQQASGAMLLLKAVTQKPSVFYVRQDDWFDALERRQSDVRLCDEFGRLLQAPPERPRAKTFLRVSTVRACYEAVVFARSLEPIEPGQPPGTESPEFSNDTQFPAAEPVEAPPNTDDGVPEPVTTDQAQNVSVSTPRGGGRGRH